MSQVLDTAKIHGSLSLRAELFPDVESGFPNLKFLDHKGSLSESCSNSSK